MEQKITALAAEMGVSVAELASFISCLSVWTSKGYSLAEALQKNLDTLASLAAGVSEGLSGTYGVKHTAAVALRTHLAGEVWDAVRAAQPLEA